MRRGDGHGALEVALSCYRFSSLSCSLQGCDELALYLHHTRTCISCQRSLKQRQGFFFLSLSPLLSLPVIHHSPLTVQNGTGKKNFSKIGGCYGNRIVSFYTRTR